MQWRQLLQSSLLLTYLFTYYYYITTTINSTYVYALEQSLEFIRPYMSSLSSEVQPVCADGKPPMHDASQPRQQQQLQPIAGVIGASASVVSVMVANMLQLFKVP